MTRLSEAQRAALAAMTRGPLFRNRSGSWSRAGLEPFQSKTVDRLVALGLADRGRSPRHGIPLVAITPAGGLVLGVSVKPRETKADPDAAARAASALHERIAP